MKYLVLLWLLIGPSGCLKFEGVSPAGELGKPIKDVSAPSSKLPAFHQMRFNSPQRPLDLRSFIHFKLIERGNTDLEKVQLKLLVPETGRTVVFTDAASAERDTITFSYPSDLKGRRIKVIQEDGQGKKIRIINLNQDNEILYEL